MLSTKDFISITADLVLPQSCASVRRSRNEIGDYAAEAALKVISEIEITTWKHSGGPSGIDSESLF